MNLSKVQNFSKGLILLVAAVLPGCAAGLENVKEAPTVTDFLLGPEDVLEITVWRNQDLSRQTVVRPDGMVSMPLIGDVQASGQTANQLAARIADRLKEFKESPSVSVSVKEVNSYNVFVLGEVQKPGKYQLAFRMRSRAEPIYFMRFVGATKAMEQTMNERIMNFHAFAVELEVKD